MDRLKNLGGDKIEWLGFVSDKQLARLYGEAKGFLAVAENEDFGMTVVEAMSMGIPSVGTNVVGIKDLIINGTTGYLVEEEDYRGLADVTITLLNRPELLTEFSHNAQKITREKFDFNDGIKQYEQFYSSVSLGIF